MTWDDKAFLAGCKGQTKPSALAVNDQAYLGDVLARIHEGKPGLVVSEGDDGKLHFIATNMERREAITMLQRVIEHQWEQLIAEERDGTPKG